MVKLFSAIDSFFEEAEIKFGRKIVMVAVGFFFLLIASMFTAIRMETFFHGNGFTRLSVHPFDLESENDLRYRILSPLLGYILFFRGPAFKYFMLIALSVFFGLIYFFSRRKHTPSESIAITALFAFSTLSFHQLYFPAYTDPISYILILLFLHNFKKRYINSILLSLMLFNHENTVFLFPFFFLLMAGNKYKIKSYLKIFFVFLSAVIPYLIFRKIISMNSLVGFTISYYLDPNNMDWTRAHVLPHLGFGIFQAFRLFWLIPLIAIVINFYEKNFYESLLMIVLTAGVISQFVIAYDISRLTGMAFPLILISANRLYEFFGSKKFITIIYVIILLNFLVPSWYVGALEPIRLKPWWL